MIAWLILGMLLALAGGMACYLSVRHQHWLAQPLPARRARFLGTVLIAAALLAMGQALQWLVASFMLITWLMLVCIALPFTGALRSIIKKR